jgi:hypothetical protein
MKKIPDKREETFRMPDALPQTVDQHPRPERAFILRYENEDDRSYFVSEADGASLAVPKRREVPEAAIGQSPSPMTPVFRLLLAGFLGLAPAGLGALVLAPLAALWALAIFATRRLDRADRIRLAVALGMAAGLFAIAVPMTLLFRDRFS